MNEVGDQAGQHELVAESLKTELCPEIVNKCKDFREDRKLVRISLSSNNNVVYLKTHRYTSIRKGSKAE